jgi:ectoine hydroxylase-related dioxygenase (phytanoyl-CoA dioxygenase family)
MGEIYILIYIWKLVDNTQGDWDDRHPKPEETIPACLDPGDALLFDGAVFHGGGTNSTETERRKVSLKSRGKSFPTLIPNRSMVCL